MKELTDLVLSHANVYMEFERAYEDKQITAAEGVAIAMVALAELPKAYQNIKIAAGQAEEMTSVQKGQFITDIEDALEIANEKAERIAEAGIDFVLTSYRLQRAIVS